MRNILKILIIIITLTFISCSGNGGKIKRSQRIPDKDLVSILTDLYIADGLIALPSIHARFSAKDSAGNYIAIIEKHGYTKDRMDKTMKYYFINNPKKLEKIYDQVLARLSEIQSRLVTVVPSAPVVSYNLWTGQPSYYVPEAGITNSIFFSIPVKDTGLYELSLTTLVYRDDQSLNPRINVFFWHADSSKTGVRDYWNTIELQKDGKRHDYTLSKRLTDTTFTHFNGWLLFNDAKTGRWEKHALVENLLFRKVLYK
jgi:hypothetical protein